MVIQGSNVTSCSPPSAVGSAASRPSHASWYSEPGSIAPVPTRPKKTTCGPADCATKTPASATSPSVDENTTVAVPSAASAWSIFGTCASS